MNSTTTPRHPLLACADTIEKALTSVADIDPAYLDTRDKAAVLVRLASLGSQVETLRLRVLATAGDVAADHGCRTVADWVAPRTRTDRRVAYAQERLAQALDQTWRLVAGALADGRVHLDHARVIVKALDALPADVSVEVTQRAERRLVEHADRFGPTDLARLGRRIMDVVAPEVGDEHERRALERAEARAAALTRLDFKRRGDGSTDIAATVPDSVAARLKTYLESFTSPRQRTGDGVDPATGARLPADRHRGLAFCALLERLDPALLPDHGGLATTMVVTVPLESLQTGLGTAQLGTGETLTAGEARRLACTAGLVPAVLGTSSEVLDLGRTARLFTPAQRKALALRHPHCRAEGCGVPAPWCAHHTTPGAEAATPTSTTACSCATGTTSEPTTPATTPNQHPTATSATTEEREPPWDDQRVPSPAPLWSCPQCGRTFAARNQTHTCAPLGDLDRHFAGCEPVVRATYDAVLAVLADVGPYEVLAEKTRIALHVRMSFAAFAPRRRWLRGHLLLAEPQTHPRIVATTTYSPRNVLHEFVLHAPGEVDDAFAQLVVAAYRVGEQRHR